MNAGSPNDFDAHSGATDAPDTGFGAAPLSPRLDRSTAIGCLGILCVLALPTLLFLPIESWGLPVWLARLLPLLALGAAATGAWLLSTVPAGPTARSTDPLRPLTHAGLPPLLERPARAANRVGMLVAALLVALGIVGYLLVSFVATRGALLLGTVLAICAGCALLVYGVLAARLILTVPALRWVRVPIQGGLVTQALPMAVIGLVTLVWALVVAAGEGYVWAPIGVGVVILGGVLVGPVLQRLPPGGLRRTPRQRPPRPR